MLGRCFLWALLLFSLCLVSCSGEDAPYYDPPIEAGTEAEQMLLVYIAGDNNLSNNAQDDLQELLRAAVNVPSDCYLLAFVDENDAYYGGSRNPRILRFFNNAGVGDYYTVKNFASEVASCDALAMKDILEWVLLNYPSKKYDLVLWSHGTGWLRDDGRNIEQYSFGLDETNPSNCSKRHIYIEELASVLEGLPMQPHRLMFDACFMQCIEVAYALRNSADWIIASPAELPAAGAPYDYLVPLLFKSSTGIQELLDVYVSSYKNTDMGAVLSAVRCDVLEELADVTAAVVKERFMRGAVSGYYGLLAYLPNGRFTSTERMPCFYDAASVVWGFLPSADYEQWRAVLDKAVPYRSATTRYYSDLKKTYVYITDPWCGISMYMPREGSNYSSLNADFATTEWYAAAGWNETGW